MKAMVSSKHTWFAGVPVDYKNCQEICSFVDEDLSADASFFDASHRPWTVWLEIGYMYYVAGQVPAIFEQLLALYIDVQNERYAHTRVDGKVRPAALDGTTPTKIAFGKNDSGGYNTTHKNNICNIVANCTAIVKVLRQVPSKVWGNGDDFRCRLLQAATPDQLRELEQHIRVNFGFKYNYETDPKKRVLFVNSL